jgi:AcrR family transcriptional regulator
MKSATRTYTQTQRAESTLATRERLLAAAHDAFTTSSYEDVTVAAVARAAGVSHQTLINHFESKEGLFSAVVGRMKEQVVGARATVRPGSVRRIVDHLMGQYEAMGDVNARYAMTADRFPIVADEMAEARDNHQTWLAELIGDQLPSRARERDRVVNALHAATDVYTWKLLRRDLGLSRTETAATMTMLAERLLAGGDDTGR